MKILVTGAGGQVGRALAQARWPAHLQPQFATRSALDIADAALVEKAIDETVRLVINAAAYTAVDKAEANPDSADTANRDGPANLARACAIRDIPLIHLSTDYVFDGAATGSYREDDPTGPTGAYGRSKLAGEQAVKSILPKHIILRTSWVFSDHPPNFLLTMLRLGTERPLLRIVADQFGGPTSARAIAAAVITIAQRVVEPDFADWGVYHFSGAPDTSWHGFAEAIFSAAGKTGLIVPSLDAIATADYPTPARRPANSRLNCAKIEEVFGILRTDWETDMVRIVQQHKEAVAQ